MEQRNKRQRLNIPHICHDLVEKILEKLPVKSLVRFKCVSTQWRSTIKSKEFAERHLVHQRSRGPKVLASNYINGCDSVGVLIRSRYVEDGEEICYRGWDPYSFKWISCDGLVCYDRIRKIEVFNPATGDRRKLLPLRRSYTCFPDRVQIGFGRDNTTGTYKVVRISFTAYTDVGHCECDVFALNTCGWRYIGPIPHEVYYRVSVYANGSLYWFTLKYRNPAEQEKILAFDLHTEKFHVVPHPSFCSNLSNSIVMACLMDRLCIAETRTCDSRLDIWSMDLVERWKKTYSINLSNLCPSLQEDLGFNQVFTPIAIRENGSVVVCDGTPHTNDGRRVLKYYPRTDSLRIVCENAGIVEGYYVESLLGVW